MKVTFKGPESLANRKFKHWALSKEFTIKDGETEMSQADYTALIATHGTIGILPEASPEELAAARAVLEKKLRRPVKKIAATR